MRELAFAVFSGLSVVLLLLPAPCHVRARNSGTLIFIFWALLGNSIVLVNTIIWSGNIGNPAPVWCDISSFFSPCCSAWAHLAPIASKLIIGFNAALPCASLCIQRRLYNITRVAKVGQTPEQVRSFHLRATLLTITGQRRRDIYIDLSIGLGFPCLMMALR
jgi:pheromone a factor receptor